MVKGVLGPVDESCGELVDRKNRFAPSKGDSAEVSSGGIQSL